MHDSNNIRFACKISRLRATDLNQGVVFGGMTEEIALNPTRLGTAVHYDEMFGTVLNRFCVQAAVDLPLTVYGKGEQTRGFLNIVDTLQCVELTLNTPPAPGEFRVFNQFTQLFSVNQLAQHVQHVGVDMGLDVVVAHLPNPRVEEESHYYNPVVTKLPSLGLTPHLLGDEVIANLIEMGREHKDRIDLKVIEPRTHWGVVTK
ncbi:MAG: hypothetical protein HN348_31775 [Proteobacteria bacterium]|nr:hypothetical protein [Pseudomonadota bacterium]